MSTISQVQIGSTTYDLFDPSIRTELASNITSAHGIFTTTTDISGITDTTSTAALITGSKTGQHLEFDGNEIQSKTNATTVGTLALNVDGGPVTIAGQAISGSIGANKVWAAPSNAAGIPTMRELAEADIPALSISKISHLGDLVTSNPSAVSVKTSTYTTLGSITLVEGTWLISISVTFASNSTGRRAIAFSTSSTVSSIAASNMGAISLPAANGDITKFSNFHLGQLGQDSTYYCRAWQNSGSTLSCQCYLRAVRIK